MDADLNIFDPDTVGPDVPTLVDDLPAGGRRLEQHSIGFLATVVGATVGAVAGFYGGATDTALMRFVDLILVIPVLAILLVLPKAQITGLGGFIDAIKTVFTVFGGHIATAADGTVTPVLSGFGSIMGDLAAIGFILALLSSGATWIMGADRSQAVAAYDGAGPRWLGRFSKKYGTPIAVNLLSGIVATVFMIAAFSLTSGSTAKYFTAALGLAISTTTISYLAIFPALYLLRRKYPDVERPYTAPGGNNGAIAISGITLLWTVVAVVALLWPGALTALTHGGAADASVPTGFSRTSYELSQFIPLLIILALGGLFYFWGAKTRAQQVDITLT